MSTDTHAADVPADDPMDATLTELKSEKPEHDSGSGRFKPKGGADTKKKGDASPKKKASTPQREAPALGQAGPL